MRVLFIGGTGTISTAISRKLLENGDDLYLLNRGNRNYALPTNVKHINCDANDEKAVAALTTGMQFDVVADFIAFEPVQLARDYRLFNGKTRQFIFISSASAYKKPLSDYRITESTPLSNPLWTYSQDKIACEDFLMKMYRENAFPITIVRPSHTFDERSIPVGIHGRNGSYQVIKRIMEEKPVLIPGDGTSLWTVTHNTDFAKGFIGLMGNVHAIGESFNITSEESLTWNQIYHIIAVACGKELKPYHVSCEFLQKCGKYDFKGSLLGDKANSVVFDTSKLKRAVPDFVATKRFDMVIHECLDYIAVHKECQILDPEFDSFCDNVIEVLDKAAAEISGK